MKILFARIPRRTIVAVFVSLVCGGMPSRAAWALCNGGAVVTGTLTISADCDGEGSTPLRLGTGADVTINAGVTVSNDLWATRNGDPIAVQSGATAVSLTNNGTVFTGSQWAVTNNGSMDSLVNSGMIASGVRRAIVNSTAAASITTLTNVGTISGPFADVTNSGTIQTLNNLQGASASDPLSYVSNLPSQYNIIIAGPTDYGQLFSLGVSGNMAFDIYGNTGTSLISGVPASVLSVGTYTDVLLGFNTLAGISGTSGTYGIYEYELVSNTLNADAWNLVVTLAPVDMTTGSTYQSSDLNDTVNPVFDGGILQVSSAGTIASDFTISGNGGTIDGNGLASTFDGVMSGSGSLTFTNSGSGGGVTLTNTHSYTGATIIDARADLLLSGNGSIASSSGVANNGTLDISGTASGASIATLSGTGTILLGTRTLTITDGVSDYSGTISGSGGVTVAGGTQGLSGTNSYTGTTTVLPGATLVVSHGLGGGNLALIGDAVTPATLSVTDSIILANPISVAGDPVFNVAPGTTTTVTAPITDGVLPGDVVVAGGGTLSLRAINTYTGPTHITQGSTLALAANGALAGSPAVANDSGTFDIVRRRGDVSLAGSYSQGSASTLAMRFAPSGNQRLLIAGTASLAGDLALTAAPGNYRAGRYTLITASDGVTGTFSDLATDLDSQTSLSYALSYDANDVFLTLFPGVADSFASVNASAASLRDVFSVQSTLLSNAMQYDCAVFDARGVCASAGARNVDASGADNAGAYLIASYRVASHLRVGGFLDARTSGGAHGIDYRGADPIGGLFGAWLQDPGGEGLQIRVSAAYGDQDLRIDRDVVGTSEAGTGTSTLTGSAAQIEAGFGLAIERSIVTPYASLRYVNVDRDAYDEAADAGAVAPLHYADVSQSATTLALGMRATTALSQSLNVSGGLGAEHDLDFKGGTFSATGLAGLDAFDFSGDVDRTRPLASIGASYTISRRQLLGIDAGYRRNANQSSGSTQIYASYTLGF